MNNTTSKRLSASAFAIAKELGVNAAGDDIDLANYIEYAVLTKAEWDTNSGDRNALIEYIESNNKGTLVSDVSDFEGNLIAGATSDPIIIVAYMTTTAAAQNGRTEFK